MNKQIYEEAAEWLVEFRTEQPDSAARSQFGKWLSTSPEHVHAYLELAGTWEAVTAQPPADQADIDALIELAKTPSNVVPLARMEGHPGEHTNFFSRRRAIFASAATLLLAILGLATYAHTQRGIYTTDIGEQRSVLLSDGSMIDLNARSKLRVRIGDTRRHVELLEGQALFRVAKEPHRPFIVTSNGAQVRAVGTQFDVNQRTRGTVVTVVEGRVAVSQRRVPTTQVPSGLSIATSGEILLAAGEQVTIPSAPATNRRSAPKPQRTDIATATAWTQRRLIFDATPLDDVTAEFNRNSERILLIRGRQLDDFHVSGAFSSTDVQSFLRFLRTQEGLQVIEEPDRVIITAE